MKIIQRAKFVNAYHEVLSAEIHEPNPNRGLRKYTADVIKVCEPDNLTLPAIILIDGLEWSAMPKDAAHAEKINAQIKMWESSIRMRRVLRHRGPFETVDE